MDFSVYRIKYFSRDYPTDFIHYRIRAKTQTFGLYLILLYKNKLLDDFVDEKKNRKKLSLFQDFVLFSGFCPVFRTKSWDK